jgi:alkylation response protein AidB-like acyl-CoA dehydrogenase
VADSAVELEAAQLLTLQAAWRKQQGQLFSREASIAKVFATERAFAACNRLLPLLGIEGLTDRTPLERHLRDVRVTMIYEGTSEVQRIVIGREVMRRFAQAG